MSLTLWQVDAFAEAPLTGNPAAVCILPKPRETDWMQAVGREMNLSETAFLERREDGSYDLRWFTPAHEVDLCGHATIASAHVLWEEGFLPPDETARFHTRSGPLFASRDDDWVELDFPATPPSLKDPPPELLAAIPVEPLWCGRSRFDFVVELPSEADVRSLDPDLTLLRRVRSRGTIVTARASTAPYDYVLRFFAPAGGVDEDPVTGSAQSALGPYWQAKLGKDDLLGYQASPRGGTVRVRPRGERVLIAGKAVTVLKGELLQ
jgi:predicted PhzF superfamily epimerase YddE/YHI9